MRSAALCRAAISALMLTAVPVAAQSGTLDGDELTSTLELTGLPDNAWTGTPDPAVFTAGSPGPELNSQFTLFTSIVDASLDAGGTTISFSVTSEVVPGTDIFLPCTLTVSGIDARVAGATVVAPTGAEDIEVTVESDSLIVEFSAASAATALFPEIVIELDLRPALDFAAQPESTDVIAGDPLVLSATLVGSRDDIQIRWLRDGTPLANDNRISGANTETLVIDPALPADTGYYTIQAISRFGAFDLAGDTVGIDLRHAPLLAGLNNLLTPAAFYDPPTQTPGDDAPLQVTVADGPEIEKNLVPATLAYAADFRNGSKLRFTQFVNDTIALPGTFNLTVTDIDTPVAAVEIVSDNLGFAPMNNSVTLLSDSSFRFTFQGSLAAPLANGAATLRLLTESPFIVESQPALVAVRPGPTINPDVNNDALVNFFDVLDLLIEIDALNP